MANKELVKEIIYSISRDLNAEYTLCGTNPLSDVSGGQHSGSITVYNPQVPFVQKNLGNIEPGKVFYISGVPSKNPKRIRILLQAGNEVALNIGIRFNIDNDRKVIIRRAKHNTGWGQAERTEVRTLEDEFDSEWINKRKNQRQTASGGQYFGSKTVYNLQVPLVQRNLGSIDPGKVFYISGVPSQNPKRITISLESGHNVAFSIDIRFKFRNDRNVIVRNSRISNGWGKGERSLKTPFPFKADTFFDMMILTESSCFKVAVNNQHVLEFKHRLPFHRIDALRIVGDVRLCQARF